MTADVVVMAVRQRRLEVVLVRRGSPPFRGCWAVPGGFVGIDEPLEVAARRELAEEAGVELDEGLFELGAFGRPDRDPRGRVISIAYYALVDARRMRLRAADDAADVRWFPMSDLPPLAFDHDRMVEAARRRLVADADSRPIGVHLLPETFTMTQIQPLYQAVLGRRISRTELEKRLVARGVIARTEDEGEPVRYRFVTPASSTW